MNLKEAYSILEISPGSSVEDAKKKYRELAKKYHPDVNKEPDAEAKFKKIGEAYKVISTGEDNDPTVASRAPFNPFAGFSHQVQASNIELYATISFKESIFGCQQELKFARQGKCSSCSGKGKLDLNNGCDKCGGKGDIITQRGNMIFSQTCDKCHGKTTSEKCKACRGQGSVKTDVSVQVRVPGGVVNGNILRLNGMGNYAGSFMTMDQFTDAQLHINVIPENGLSLIGKDVVCTLNISLLEALRGCSKSVKTALGNQEILINSRSRNNEEVIIPHLGVNKLGNQRVILDVEYPEDIDKLINILTEEEI